jgi:hypothetical protein
MALSFPPLGLHAMLSIEATHHEAEDASAVCRSRHHTLARRNSGKSRAGPAPRRRFATFCRMTGSGPTSNRFNGDKLSVPRPTCRNRRRL